MTDAYHDHLTYLVAYANDDWVGFSPIVGAATALARPTPTRDRVTDLVLGLISDLLATGVLPGDLTDSDDETFVPWAIDVPAVLVRIRAEMTQLPELPDSGDICWFTTRAGDVPAG